MVPVRSIGVGPARRTALVPPSTTRATICCTIFQPMRTRWSKTGRTANSISSGLWSTGGISRTLPAPCEIKDTDARIHQRSPGAVAEDRNDIEVHDVDVSPASPSWDRRARYLGTASGAPAVPERGLRDCRPGGCCGACWKIDRRKPDPDPECCPGCQSPLEAVARANIRVIM
jgi:hypothetical protein